MQRHLVLCSTLTAIAWAMLSTAIASAQATPSDIKMFLPSIQVLITESVVEPPPVEVPNDRPAPYDVSARDVVIQLEDTPDGFYVDTSTPIEPSEALLDIGFVSGYETQLFNDDDFFVDYIAVGSLAEVFMSPEAAHIVHGNVVAAFADDPDYASLSVSSVGDETAAFVLRTTIEGYRVDYFVVLARRGNVYTGTIVGGLGSVTRLSDAVGYARRMFNKVAENGNVTASGNSEHIILNTETLGTQVLPSVQQWVENMDDYVASQLQLQ